MCHRNGEKDSYISCFPPELMLYKTLYKSLYYPESVASAGLFPGDPSDIGMALSRGQGLHPAVPNVPVVPNGKGRDGPAPSLLAPPHLCPPSELLMGV